MKRLVFNAPFQPFIHRWSEFTTALENEGDAATKDHLILLHKTLEAELKDVITAKQDFIANQVITFEHLYTIFVPGSSIYTREWGRDCASKLAQGNYFEHPKYGKCFGVNSQKVNWDGDKFGYENVQHLILAYAGTMKIEDLSAFPLEFHPDEKKVRNRLTARGKLFEQYHGYHYKHYKGFGIGKNMCGQDIKVTVDSRIIIVSQTSHTFLLR